MITQTITPPIEHNNPTFENLLFPALFPHIFDKIARTRPMIPVSGTPNNVIKEPTPENKIPKMPLTPNTMDAMPKTTDTIAISYPLHSASIYYYISFALFVFLCQTQYKDYYLQLSIRIRTL